MIAFFSLTPTGKATKLAQRPPSTVGRGEWVRASKVKRLTRVFSNEIASKTEDGFSRNDGHSSDFRGICTGWTFVIAKPPSSAC